jgi:formylglycine-generating enzyme
MKKITLACCTLLCLSTIAQAQPDMIQVPGGVFQMGDPAGNADEKPLHQVLLQDFLMAKTETTYADFSRFVDATGYVTDAERSGGSYVWDSLGWHQRTGVLWQHDESGVLRAQTKGIYGQYPVLHVSWNDAVQYCNWRSKQEKLVQVYEFQGDTLRINFKANGYRLPTEAEWEYAASGGIPKEIQPYAGNGTLKTIGWYSGNAHHGVKPVRLKRPNARGLFDLTGNVWEWCQDWYDREYYSTPQQASNPSGPALGKERSVRGGSWNNNATHCRIANRTSRFPDFRDGSIGFRVVRTAKL